MQKKNIFFAVLLFFSTLPMLLFSGCDKDTHCYLEVIVLDEAKREPIPLAKIIVNQDGGSLYAEGVADENGRFETVFNAPAILTVTAKVPLKFGERRGETSVRLIEGEMKTATVTVPEEPYTE